MSIVSLHQKTEIINLPQSVYVGHLAQCKDALKTTHDFTLELFADTTLKSSALFSVSHGASVWIINRTD